MNLLLNIIDETDKSTVSELLADNKHVCYVIEDAGQEGEKVMGETRIPSGTYDVIPRREGGFYNRYVKRFGHDFVPWIIGVPNFTWILFHVGNTHIDTRGCLLPCSAYYRDNQGHYVGINSTDAYVRLYQAIKRALGKNMAVKLTVNREYKPAPAPAPEDEQELEEVIAEIRPQPPQPTIPTDRSGCAYSTTTLLLMYAIIMTTLWLYLKSPIS